MKIERAVWLFLAALTAVRLTLLASSDLEFDEAHYWMWSKHPAPAYFSKGPGVAFAIRASTALFGDNEFGVRFFSPLLAAGTSVLLFYFCRRLFGSVAALWAVIGLNAVPIFNIGSYLMTIDPLSLFFWVAAMLSFWRVVETTPKFSFYWLLTGGLVGLGFLCKYTNAFELVSIILVLALNPKLRSEFRRAGLYLTLLVFALFCIPPLWWNSQHAWITLAHLRARGGLQQSFGLHPGELLTFIGEHFLVYSPLVFLAIAWAVIALWNRSKHQPKRLFLMWFGLPVFAFYAVLSINKAAAPNWDALAFPSLALLAVAFWRERLEASRSWRWAALLALLLALLSSLAAIDSDILRDCGIQLRRDPADRMRGWKSATTALEQVRKELEAQNGQHLFLIADERDRASEISFYLRDKRVEGPGHPPCYLVESQDLANQFSFWPRYDEFVQQPAAVANPEQQTYTEESGVNLFVGRSALYVQDANRGSNPPHNIRVAFGSVGGISQIQVRRFGKTIRTWNVYLCLNYHTLPL